MPKNQKVETHAFVRFIDYKPAELRIGKDWIIVYYAKNPITKELVRFRLRVPVLKATAERKKYGKNIVAEINQKLETGWSPFLEESGKSFKTVNDCIAQYTRQIKKEEREGIKRPDTIRSYESYLRILQEFIATKKKINFVAEINRAFVVNYLDYIYNDRGNSGTSYNNHLNFCGNFCNWLIDRGYLAENPTNGISRKAKVAKIRKQLPVDVKKLLSDNLPQFSKQYYTLCMCTYYAFIRGTELTKIKVGDVDLKNNFISVSCTSSKNKKSEIVTIPEELAKLLAIHIDGFNNNFYLFAENNFSPGPVQLKAKKIRDTWTKVRTQLNLPIEYKFYSLKDTGITDLLNVGIASIKVRNQVRHHDIKITELYTSRNTQSDNEIINSKIKF